MSALKYRLRGMLRNCAHRFGLNVSRHVPLSRALISNGINIVFDIGANQGQFGAELRQHGYRGRIVSFEPMTAAYTQLMHRSRKDKLWEVHERCAVGAEERIISINVSKNSGSSSILPIIAEHTVAAPDSVYVGKESVNQIRFDQVFADYLRPDDRFFMKIDTQGYEKEVMLGAQEALKRVAGLQVEISFFELYENQPSYKYFLKWAEENSFCIWSIHDGFSNLEVSKTLQADICFFRV